MREVITIFLFYGCLHKKSLETTATRHIINHSFEKTHNLLILNINASTYTYSIFKQ